MPWYEECYTRLLIDNHITEHDPSFMTKFDPANYVAMVKRGGFESAMVYACDHNGNCYYPTKVGHQHANLHGRDIFGETVNLLRAEGIVPIAYTTALFHNHAAQSHPEWRMEAFDGHQQEGRFWLACPNSAEYVKAAKAEISEVIAYDVDGIFIDMVFWPIVCVCPHCRAKFRRETGMEIPHIVNWSDPAWIAFQQARERWMVEFVDDMRQHVKSERPEISVTYQFSPVLFGWRTAQCPGIAAACEYASGDFYGGRYQASIVTKVLSAFSRNVPFEFMTSRCVNLWDHTSTKSDEELLCHAALTLANGGACFFIDAINPDGTLCPEVYDKLGRVNAAVRPFLTAVRDMKASLLADVGLYFSMPSHIDPRDNGTDMKLASGGRSNMLPPGDIQTIKETIGTSVILGRANIPYKIITSDRPDLHGLRTLIVNNAMNMTTAEVDSIQQFVYDGGTLVATGCSSLNLTDGTSSGDFQLADVFGVTYTGKMSKWTNYLAYHGEPDTVPDGTATGNLQYVLSDMPSPMVKATTATVLGQVSEPLFNPGDAAQYASVHSNPPGAVSEYAGLTVNSYGQGRCVYLYSSLFALQNESQQSFGMDMMHRYAASELLVACDAPRCVEVTVLQSADTNGLLLCFTNYQLELPNVPVHDIHASVRLPQDRELAGCRRVSDGSVMGYVLEDGVLSVCIPVVETEEMVRISLLPVGDNRSTDDADGTD